VTKIVNHVPVVQETMKVEQVKKEELAAEGAIPASPKRDTANNVAQKKVPKKRRRT